ncbi:glycoside hydrolase superfamily [Aspergillus foveolatus]|uniref:glycoside hydrolase superfamily n=1 Tax=Aspergillus foveolatus TaxID=210207 RepID=UPI003CCCB35F
MMLKHAALALAALQCVAGLRFAMYIDEWHVNGLPGSDQTQGITHAIMGFAKSTDFTGDAPAAFQPFEPVSTFRNRFSPDTKVMIAIGGWGDSAGFSAGAKDETSREQYAKNVAAMLESTGFDGVDIDWEYPGGNGEDYKKVPNDQKVDEIETFPLLLQALRTAVGDKKIISIATPGKREDMIAYTTEQGPKIWPSVDMINVMSYDLMNRRNNETKHHTGIADSHDTIKAYLEIGAPPEKINLGFAYYAKWFSTQPDVDCGTYPIGCPTVAMEAADGSDNGKSGAMTFEPQNMAAPPSDLKVSTDMTCGLAKGTRCPAGTCCSIYGNCGTGDDFCLAACDSNFGECKGVPIQDSWRRARAEGQTDEEGGGQYYMDTQNHLFWTWDTPALMTRKFTKIVDVEKLGGVMAWSLGEDTYNFEHLKAMQEGVAQRAGGTATPARTRCSGGSQSACSKRHGAAGVSLSRQQRLAKSTSVQLSAAVGFNSMKCFIVLTFVPLILALAIPNTNNNDDDPSSVESIQQQRLFETETTVAEYKRPGLRIYHGTIIPANKERTRATATNSTPSYIHALQTEQAPYNLLARYSDALFALGLLLLVPLALGIVELAGRLFRCISVDECPERGREKQGIESLQEKEEWAFRQRNGT